MATPTVPNSSFEVAEENLLNLDRLMNQPSGVVTNREGVALTPIPVINQQLEDLVDDAEQTVLAIGWDDKGTFAAGATLTNSNQTLSNGTNYYRWSGAFPKVVSAGSAVTPLGVGGWLLVGDSQLRSELAAADTLVTISGKRANVIEYISPTNSTKNSSFILGELGTNPVSPPSRVSWAYNSAPTTVTNGLFLTGNYIEPTVLGASIFQGRTGYYSYLTDDCGVASSMGGDNYVDQLAGMAYGYHIDLIKDPNGLGSHSANFGGSWKRLMGDYSGSAFGTRHIVSGTSAAIIAGESHRLGSESDALLSRRSTMMGGQLCQLDGIASFCYSAEQSVVNAAGAGILGGTLNTNLGDQSVILSGNTNEHTATADRSVTLSGQRNKTTAFGAITFGWDCLNDVDFSLTQSNGKFVNQGDCQVHHLVGRKLGAAGSTTVDITSQGGGGSPYLYTPRTNTVALFDFNVVGARTDIQGESCSFRVVGTISNIGGTLTIKAQTTTLIHRDDAAYNCVLALAGGSTAVVLRATVPSTSHVTRWNASGTITMLQSA